MFPGWLLSELPDPLSEKLSILNAPRQGSDRNDTAVKVGAIISRGLWPDSNLRHSHRLAPPFGGDSGNPPAHVKMVMLSLYLCASL